MAKSVKIIQRMQKADKQGYAPLFVLSIEDRKPVYKSLGIKVLPEQWDQVSQRVKKHPQAQGYNEAITRAMADEMVAPLPPTPKPKYDKETTEWLNNLDRAVEKSWVEHRQEEAA
jgi:hypothetical protein